MEKVKELHSIKKFRAGNFGIIRLNRLAVPRDIIVKIGDEEFTPIGYDTYGHPIISEENFIYYKALKSIRERSVENLVPEVEYTPKAFAVKPEVYDSIEGIEKIEKSVPDAEKLKALKEVLIYRKQAKFIGKELHTFILYGKYALHSDGRVYMCKYNLKGEIDSERTVINLSEVEDFELLEEVHIPRHDEVCAICGKGFTINDIKTFSTTEDENGRKEHKRCLKNYVEAVEHKRASRIIDAVYQDYPESEVIQEGGADGKKEKVWYLYHTKQGDVAIRFKNKVIEIQWFGNFKPFKLEKLFEDEDVTKRRLEDSKVIHAWSTDDAIKYLSMVKKA